MLNSFSSKSSSFATLFPEIVFRKFVVILLIEAVILLAPAAIAFLFLQAIYELIAKATAIIIIIVDVAKAASPIVKSKSETLKRLLSYHGLFVGTHYLSQLTFASGSLQVTFGGGVTGFVGFAGLAGGT